MHWAAAMGRLTALVALTAVVTVAAAGVAAAHAVLLTSSPAAGSRLDEAPTDVALTFSEPVTPVALDVTGPEGQPATPDGADSFDGTAAVVEVPLRPNLPDGVYVVSWQVVSADSHPLRGAFEFAIGPFTPRGVIAAPDSPSILVEIGYTITRWFGFAGLVLLVGATIFLLRVWQGGRRPGVWAVPAAGAAIATLASVGQIILQGPYTGQSLEEVVGSTFGTTLLLRMALLITAAATVVLFARWPTSPADQLVVGGPVALGLLSTWPLTGHARTGDPVWVAVASDTVHLAAVAVWLGGLAMLVLFVLRRTTRDEAVPLVRRFSPIALGAVLIIAGTGTYQSWREVGTLPALTGTEYGRLLVAKITLFVVLIGLGWLARRWIHRRTAATAASLRASVGAEVLIAVAVLALTAQLVATEPARETYSTPLHTTIALEHGERLAVDVTPARVGTNTVRLVVRGPDGQPMDVPELTAEISLEERDIGPLAIQLQRVAVGEHVAETASFPYAGRWELAITVRTTEFHQTTTTADITVR